MPQYSTSPLGLVLTSDNTEKPIIGSYVISGNNSLQSIFRNGTASGSYTFNPANKNYNATLNDISTTGLINYTSANPPMKLGYADFAYLKNLGVYPNNRLIVARRYCSPVDDDLTSLDKSLTPMATLISWVPDNTDFISTKFGEEWMQGDASFTNILNELGHDAMMGDNRGKNLGSFIAGGAGVVPLPGFTEGLQYQLFKSLGMTDIDASKLPYGNPNLIKESMRRKTGAKDEPWSGLKCKFEVKMVVEYEQKFINGVDPTIVYYDIIANALTFGTSESQFQFRGSAASGFNKFLNNIGSGDSNKIKSALLQFVVALSDSLKAVGQAIYDKLSSVKETVTSGSLSQAAQAAAKATAKALTQIANTIITGLVNKYKIRIISVVNSLTGTPSAPWHVTVGNPRRPIFSSGDMVMQEVTITMGKVLAFNDLPSSIKLEFSLSSARDIGAQEIFKKLNCGKQRNIETYQRLSNVFVDSDLGFTSDDINNAQNNLAKTKAASFGKVNVSSTGKYNTEAMKSAALQAFPSAITGLPGTTYLVDDRGIPNADGSTTNPISAQITVPQLNQTVILHNDWSITNTDGKNLGNWTPNGQNTVLNFDNQLNSSGKPQTITLPVVASSISLPGAPNLSNATFGR